MRTEKKQKLAQLRRWRIRKKVTGSKIRPRMTVRFTNENIHVQFIDDDAGVTLIGALAAKHALDKGIKEVVFDRGGARYHGKVKALADAAREAGLKF